jgi:hypothetical protein
MVIEKQLNSGFEFIKNLQKLSILKHANSVLKIDTSKTNKIIFVYSKPKVGSTSLVSSIRLFASNKYNVFHIHDENMLKALTNISDVTINEIILYNKYIGKDVYVIDVYRSPIERKISTFFEKIDTYHFNNTFKNIQKYDMNKIITRFNKIFPYIGTGDLFLDKYEIPIPEQFDYTHKFLQIEHNGIKYIKLRLCDSEIWENILANLLEHPIKIVKDYETTSKPIKDLYIKFKEKYKIPKNYLDELRGCKYLNYYYSSDEQTEYLSKWSEKSTILFTPFTLDEYNTYEYICIENKYMDTIQDNHYLDEGCVCNSCQMKRQSVIHKLLNGSDITERIVHNEVNTEIMLYKINTVKKANQYLKNTAVNSKKSRITNMKNIVNIK